ncbi:WD40-repeat-containing domain protein [Chytridium lagenaria]|nr:WD40-repeat-containing domain protein [Chytridium lagenaria]
MLAQRKDGSMVLAVNSDATSSRATEDLKARLDPAFILRGHTSDVQCLAFLLADQMLASGDANGTLILWSMSTLRPSRMWKAHAGGILNVAAVYPQKSTDAGKLLLSQGRDDLIHIWDLTTLLETVPSTSATRGVAEKYPDPSPIQSFPVNSLNFCSFDWCFGLPTETDPHPLILSYLLPDRSSTIGIHILPSSSTSPKLLVRIEHENAKPSLTDSETKNNTGMCMAMRFFRQKALVDSEPSTPNNATLHGLKLASCFENGEVIVWDCESSAMIVRTKVHSEPALCLDVLDDGSAVVSGGADGRICVTSTIRGANENSNSIKTVAPPNCKGIASIRVRKDSKLIVAGCWDNSIRLHTVKKLTPLATLASHHKAGVASVALVSASTPAAILQSNMDLDVESSNGQTSEGTRTAVTTFKVQTGALRSSHLSDDSGLADNLFAVGARDARISLWRMY